eukprot:scaffold2053_cov112-Cylindrotheca_fusiformis.AAC.5
MPSFLSTLSLLATIIVAVTNGDDGTQCDFCPNGIELPNEVVDGKNCSEVASILLNDPFECAVAGGAYEVKCCPDSIDGSRGICQFCPDGLKHPDAEVDNNGRPFNCALLYIGAPLLDDEHCDKLIELGTSTCCPASAISSMIAFVAAAGIGYMVAF